MTQDPLICPCGGRQPVYSSKASATFTTQYRRCESCGRLSKTHRFNRRDERQLSAAEVDRIADIIADVLPVGNDPDRFAFFVVARRL